MAQEMTLRFSLITHTYTPVQSISPLKSTSGRRWNVFTPSGNIACSYVIHATNAYVSHLLPHMHGPAGVIPGRGQVMGMRATCALQTTRSGLTKASSTGSRGPSNARASGRWLSSVVVAKSGARSMSCTRLMIRRLEEIGRATRQFLPAVFPGRFDPAVGQSGVMGFTASGDPFVSLNGSP
ncbi:hypothetical protein BDW22DRAFT_1361316 [Trametopsis cervina]|nr:hypothetical protein BDW22DRAFT_1361316 [Trametopsis cervina]